MKSLDPVEKFVFEGLQRKVASTFRCMTAWSTGTDDVKSVARLFNGKPVSYPYATLKLNGSTLSTDRFNLHSAAFRGTRIKTAADGSESLFVRFLPVDFQVSVRFVSNEFNDMLIIQNSWLFSTKDGQFSYDVQYGETVFGCTSNLDTSLSLSQREANPDNIPEYQLEASLVVRGFVSRAIPEAQSLAKTAAASVSTPHEVVWKFPN